MRPLAVLVLCLATAVPAAAAEPEAVDPQAARDRCDAHAVLDAARADAAANRHAQALEGFEWFHANALRCEEALYGVRLSFALSDWRELADVYPPALDALRRTRNETLDAFLDPLRKDDAFHLFHDFVSLNEELGDEAWTAEVFRRLDATDPVVAGRVFQVAQPALVRAKEYAVCGRYIEPQEDWQSIRQAYELDLRIVKERLGERSATARPGQRDPFEDFAQESFQNRSAMLVALLVKNGRLLDAQQVVHEAQVVSRDLAFASRLGAALEGRVPEPWP